MTLAKMAPPRLILPRYATPPLHDESASPRLIAFSEKYLKVLKGPLAGQDMAFSKWQTWLAGELLELTPLGGYRYRRGLIGVGRQTGKSLFGSSLALWSLVTGPYATEIYSAAGDRQQAKIVYNEVKRQVEQSKFLSEHITVYRDAMECKLNDGIYRALSADARLQQGLSPQLVIFDEVHVQRNDELWDALTLGTGARVDPLVVGITTAGDDPESLAGRLYDYGKRVASGETDDDTFGFWWWEPAQDDCDLFDHAAWEQGNPSLAEGLSFYEDMDSSAKQQTPTAFRRYRLNQWRRHGGKGWMDMLAWDAATLEGFTPEPGSDIVVGFDGSVDQDATALVAISVEPEVPVMWTVAVWEPPEHDDTWQVPRAEVHATVEMLFQDFNVVKMGADPAWWRSELQEWAERFGEDRVLDWPVTHARMGPATTSMYARVKDGRLANDGSEVLRRHVSNAVAKDVAASQVTITKERKGSVKKIDAAVSGCIAVDMLERYTDDGAGVLQVF